MTGDGRGAGTDGAFLAAAAQAALVAAGADMSPAQTANPRLAYCLGDNDPFARPKPSTSTNLEGRLGTISMFSGRPYMMLHTGRGRMIRPAKLSPGGMALEYPQQRRRAPREIRPIGPKAAVVERAGQESVAFRGRSLPLFSPVVVFTAPPALAATPAATVLFAALAAAAMGRLGRLRLPSAGLPGLQHSPALGRRPRSGQRQGRYRAGAGGRGAAGCGQGCEVRLSVVARGNLLGTGVAGCGVVAGAWNMGRFNGNFALEACRGAGGGVVGRREGVERVERGDRLRRREEQRPVGGQVTSEWI
jgi:hypothetical protein